MSVPSFKEFFKPILIFMSDGELHTKKELWDEVIEYFKFNKSEINEKLPSGKITRVEDRVGWIIQYLRKSLDRKSTRLNSSHALISYAVFCLKKKINKKLLMQKHLQ